MDGRQDLSQLELLPALVLRKIVKLMGRDELKALRLTSRTLRNQVEINENTVFECWNLSKYLNCQSLDSSLTPDCLIRFSGDVQTVKVVRVLLLGRSYLDGKDIKSSVKVLLRMHPELEEIHLGLKIPDRLDSLMNMLEICGRAGPLLKSLTLSGSSGLEFELDDGLEACVESLRHESMLYYFIGMAQLIMITCCTSVKKLKVHDGSILDSLYSANIAFPVLESLDLTGCSNITDDKLAWILNMARLKVLRLTANEQTTDILRELPSSVFSDLEEVVFSRYRDSGSPLIIPTILGKLGRNLKVIRIPGVRFSEEDLYKISLHSFPHLENVDLSLCDNFTDSTLCHFLKHTGAMLKVLSLSFTEFTGENLNEICTSCSTSKLEKLDLSGSKLTENGFAAVLRRFGSNLKDLNVTNTKITGEDISRINLDFVQLEKLDLSNCTQLTENGVVAILTKFGPTLRYIDLSFNSNLTGEGLSDTLFDACPRLWYLDDFKCTKLTDCTQKIIRARFGKRTSEKKLFDHSDYCPYS